MGDIIKVAVLPIINKKLLMCRKEGVEQLINLGGKLIQGEIDEECARREVREEAQCEITDIKYFNTFTGPIVNEPNSKIELRCYFAKLVGTPRVRPGDSVLAFVYIDKKWEQAGHKLPPTFKKAIAVLIGQGYL